MTNMSHQTETTHIEIKVIEKYQLDILELKTTVAKINCLEGLSSRSQLAEDRISKLKERPREIITQSDQQRERKE